MTAGGATELIVLRGILGLGAALVMPATLSTITGTFPPEKRTRAVSVWAAVAGGSAVLGLLSSGILLEWFGLAVGVRPSTSCSPPSRWPGRSASSRSRPIRTRRGSTSTGAAISVLGLVALVFSIIEAPDHGWLAARTLAGFALAVVAGIAFVLVELRKAHPLLDPRIFRHKALAAGSMSIFAQFFAFFGFTFVILQYLQLVRDESPLVAALSLLPMAAAMMPVARLAPTLVAKDQRTPGLRLRPDARRRRARDPLAARRREPVLADAGRDHGPRRRHGRRDDAGHGRDHRGAAAAQQGVASALNDLSREVGGAVGIAVVGSVLASGYRSQLDADRRARPVAERARESFALAEQRGPGRRARRRRRSSTACTPR